MTEAFGNEETAHRLRIREELIRHGMNPYPHKVHFVSSIPEIVASNSPAIDFQGDIDTVGRIYNIRRHGSSTFVDLMDMGIKLQVYLEKDTLGDTYDDFKEWVGRGDHLLVRGKLFFTRAGELTLKVKEFSIISKALREPPILRVDSIGREHGGLRNVEERYRKRHLDLLVNPEARRTFLMKSSIVSEMRRFMNDRGFIDACSTPILQPFYGGACAKPFKTWVNALGEEWYLRISPELYLKRLIIGGINKVYEIGAQFRNESITTRHNPEFLMMEAYEAYADYNDMMKLTEELVLCVAQMVVGTTIVRFNDNEIDLKPPWPRVTMFKAINEYAGYEVQSMTDPEIQNVLIGHKIELQGGYNRGLAIAQIFEKLCEGCLVQPTFIIDYPRETSPLCKVHRDNPDLIERFELYIGGIEIANAYTELNDPVVQRQLFLEQAERRRLGDEEAQQCDEGFLEALTYGMPPTGGVGMGIDRFAMILTGCSSIKEVISFPIVKGS